MQKATDTKSDKPEKVCPHCGGSGWKNTGSGIERRVTRCNCYFESQAARLLEFTQIPARYTQCTFSNYRTGVNDPLSKARLDVENWARQYPISRTGLILLGNSGVGKTHLACAALKVLVKKGFHCLFCDYRDLLKQIQNSYNPSVGTTELGLLQPIFDSEVLLLDDLGAVRPSEWVWDTISLVLNNRYNSDKTTLITSNFIDGPAAEAEGAYEPDPPPVSSPDQEAAGTRNNEGNGKKRRPLTLGDRVGNRMRSRLFEMCRPVLLAGEDHRYKLRALGLR